MVQSAYLDWVTSPFTDWHTKAREELDRAERDGLSAAQVRMLRGQLAEAARADDEEAARDVYNVAAAYRAHRGTRRDSPAEPAPVTELVQDGVTVVVDAAGKVGAAVTKPIAAAIPWWVYVGGAAVAVLAALLVIQEVRTLTRGGK